MARLMMQRREFLFAGAAVLTAAKLAHAVGSANSESVLVKLPFKKKRWLTGFTFSSMPTADDLRSPEWREHPVQWAIKRDWAVLFPLGLNPRATFRWVGNVAGGLEFGPDNVMTIEVDPCFAHTNIHLEWDHREYAPGTVPHVSYSSYRWEHKKLVFEHHEWASGGAFTA